MILIVFLFLTEEWKRVILSFFRISGHVSRKSFFWSVPQLELSEETVKKDEFAFVDRLPRLDESFNYLDNFLKNFPDLADLNVVTSAWYWHPSFRQFSLEH